MFIYGFIYLDVLGRKPTGATLAKKKKKEKGETPPDCNPSSGLKCKAWSREVAMLTRCTTVCIFQTFMPCCILLYYTMGQIDKIPLLSTVHIIINVKEAILSSKDSGVDETLVQTVFEQEENLINSDQESKFEEMDLQPQPTAVPCPSQMKDMSILYCVDIYRIITQPPCSATKINRKCKATRVHVYNGVLCVCHGPSNSYLNPKK